jgi:hypothetical protein
MMISTGWSCHLTREIGFVTQLDVTRSIADYMRSKITPRTSHISLYNVGLSSELKDSAGEAEKKKKKTNYMAGPVA